MKLNLVVKLNLYLNKLLMNYNLNRQPETVAKYIVDFA